MLCVQKRVRRTNINLSKSNFDRICDDYNSVFILANSTDPDETSHLGLHCLYMLPI